jgi:SAM-dependent methyltransferase
VLPDRVVLVDWNCAVRGNGALDVAFLAPSLRLEGGPLPEETLPGGAALAAVVSGFFACRAGRPVIPEAPRARWIQLRQLRIALPWAARVLGLPAPDLHWGRREEARTEALFAAGQIDEAAWHQRMEELIGDLYLSSDDVRAQSGKSGEDETDWRWSREPILDAMPPGGRSVLDVGCANGLLMESLRAWGAERGLVVEPHGLDISWRLAALARRRLPQWADRIWVGNIIDWTPPRRFDLVNAGLDYVPAPRQRALVTRLLGQVVAPGGRLVLRPERVVPGVDDLVRQVQSLGFEIGGVIERPHPRGGAEMRRTVWLGA